jgi:hypothetical protein
MWPGAGSNIANQSAKLAIAVMAFLPPIFEEWSHNELHNGNKLGKQNQL